MVQNLESRRKGRVEKTKKIERRDAKERNAVAGKFWEGKRKYGLARIFARQPSLPKLR